MTWAGGKGGSEADTLPAISGEPFYWIALVSYPDFGIELYNNDHGHTDLWLGTYIIVKYMSSVPNSICKDLNRNRSSRSDF